MDPRPVRTGTDTYYLDRVNDFLRRRPEGTPPSYYEAYGNKCLHQFRAVQPDLTEAGQAWLEATLRALQELMEDKRRSDPTAFAQIELSDDDFHDFAFSTHSKAYVSSGILRLPIDDLWRILRTPDITDLLSHDGFEEIVDVATSLDLHDVAQIVRATFRIGSPSATPALDRPPRSAMNTASLRTQQP